MGYIIRLDSELYFTSVWGCGWRPGFYKQAGKTRGLSFRRQDGQVLAGMTKVRDVLGDSIGVFQLFFLWGCSLGSQLQNAIEMVFLARL